MRQSTVKPFVRGMGEFDEKRSKRIVEVIMGFGYFGGFGGWRGFGDSGF